MTISMGKKQKIIIACSVFFVIVATVVSVCVYFFVLRNNANLEEYLAWCGGGIIHDIPSEVLSELGTDIDPASILDGTGDLELTNGIMTAFLNAFVASYSTTNPPSELQEYHAGWQAIFEGLASVFKERDPDLPIDADEFLATMFADPDLLALAVELNKIGDALPQELATQLSEAGCP